MPGRHQPFQKRRNVCRPVMPLCLFLVIVLCMTPLSCASQKPPDTGKDLFVKAEEGSKKIASRMEDERRVDKGKREEDLERIEEENRKQAIKKYRSLLKQKDRLDPATYETSLVNLGNVVFEQCLANYRKAMKAYGKAYKKYSSGASVAEPTLPRYDFEPAREVYRVFLQAFPGSPYVPEVTYNMAYAYEEEGDLDKAVSLYDELALTAPDTRFAPEVFMRLGEHHFEMNQFDRAIQYYKKAMDLGDTPFYDKALFKIGWSYYAKSQFKKAREAFARVLDLQAKRKMKKQEDLYKESLEILAKILSETGGASALEQFLKEHQNPPYGLDLSLQMGNHFQETARYQDAIETYRKILLAYPLSAQSPFIEQSLLTCLKTERRFPEAEKLQASMLDRYGKDTDWYKANQDPELRKQVDTILRNNLNAMILAHHKAARENKDPREYETAIELYRKALGYFPEGQEAYDTRFRFAECLFESGRLEEAAREYEFVSKTEPYDTYREKAASKRIQCLEQLRATDKIDMNTLLASYGDYVRMNPQSPKTPPLLFKQGEILFNNSHYNEANVFFQQIITKYPDVPEVRRAWSLELESLFHAGRYTELEQACKNLFKQSFPLTPDQKNRAEHLLRFSQFEQARGEQEKGNFRQAAARYEQLVEAAPAIQIAPDALFNAAVCYREANDWPKAAGCFEKIVARYPGSKHYKDSLLAPLPYYEETEQWDRILGILGNLHALDPKNELAKESLYKIGKHFYHNGQFTKARETFSRYAARYPGDTSRGLEIAYLEARMNEDQGNKKGAVEGYKRFLAAYKKAKKRNPDVNVDPTYVARAQFLLMDPVYDSYMSIRLREPLKRSLSQKQSLLDRVVGGYMDTAKSGSGEYALAAAFRIGRAYEEFGQSLLNSEIPKGMNEEEILVYKDLLKQQAAPYMEKAEGAYQVALEKSREKGVLNPWVMKTYRHLAALDPEHYPPLLQDVVLWKESFKEKRSLIRTIDQSNRRAFSGERAANLQNDLNEVLVQLQKSMQEGNMSKDQILDTILKLQLILKKEPSLFEVHYNLGVLYQIIDEPGKAEAEYRSALKQNPRLPLAHLNLGILYLQKGNIAKAEEHFQDMTLLSPRYAGAWYLLGVSKNKQKAYDQAVAPLETSISLLPQFLDPYIELGRAKNRKGELEEARKAFQTVQSHPKVNTRLLRKLAWFLLEDGYDPEAVETYNRLVKNKGATYEDWNNLGLAYLREGKPDPAKNAFTKAMKKDPDRPEASNNLGLMYLEKGEYEKAVALFLQASRIQPSFLPALLNAAVVYGEYLENVEKATDLMKKYLTMGGTHQKDMLEKWVAGGGKESSENGEPDGREM